MTASEPTRAEIAALSGLRRALYRTALSQGVTPAKAYRVAAARCCLAPVGASHAAGCENTWDDAS